MICPCCRQAITTPEDTLFDPISGRLSRGDAVVQFTPQQADIFSALWDHYPTPMHTERLVCLVNGIMGETFSDTVLKTQMHHIRAKLRGTGVTVRTHYARGYQLEFGDAA